MNRLMICCISLIYFSIYACSNSDVKNDPVLPEQEKQLRELILQHPDSVLLKENLVQYLRDKGSYEQAIAETNSFLQKDPLNDRLWHIDGTLQFENGDTGSAIRAFEKAIVINPAIDYITTLGSLYAQTKNPKALTVADTLLKVPVVNSQEQGYFIKGMFFSYSGDKPKAIRYFDSCLKLDYRDVLAYREKAICLYDLVKYEEALVNLEKAVALRNTFDEGYYWMGRCYEKLGKIKQAAENYQVALQLDPGYAEAKDALKRLQAK